MGDKTWERHEMLRLFLILYNSFTRGTESAKVVSTPSGTTFLTLRLESLQTAPQSPTLSLIHASFTAYLGLPQCFEHRTLHSSAVSLRHPPGEQRAPRRRMGIMNAFECCLCRLTQWVWSNPGEGQNHPHLPNILPYYNQLFMSSWYFII